MRQEYTPGWRVTDGCLVIFAEIVGHDFKPGLELDCALLAAQNVLFGGLIKLENLVIQNFQVDFILLIVCFFPVVLAHFDSVVSFLLVVIESTDL